MKKKIIIRGALGFLTGITIGYLITIIMSLVFANGYYSPCVPELISIMGNEINAVILQALLSGLLGAGFGACSVIWEIERWSIVTQTGIYFTLVSIIMLPIAWILYWMEHSVGGFLSYFVIFLFIFALIWVIQFLIGKQIVRKMNDNLHKAREDKSEGNNL